MGRTFLLGLAGIVLTQPHPALSQKAKEDAFPEALIRELSTRCKSTIYRYKNENFSKCLARLKSIDRSTNSTPISTIIKFTDYPINAFREKRMGKSTILLGIDENGKVSSCVVSVSSGHSDLDETACNITKERGRFSPATDKYGTAIASTYESEVNWRYDLGPLRSTQRGGSISDEDYPSKMAREGKSGSVIANFIVNEFGRVENCKATVSSGYNELDDETCKLITRRYRYKPAIDKMGVTISEIKNQRIDWYLPNFPIPIVSDEVLFKSTARCSLIGFTVGTEKYQQCLSEQIVLLSR